MPLPIVLGGAAISGIIVIPMIVRALLGVGFAVVTYTGIQMLWTQIQADIWSNLGSVSANISTILVMARVDDAIAVVLSAGTSKLVLKGLNAAGAFSRVRWKFND